MIKISRDKQVNLHLVRLIDVLFLFISTQHLEPQYQEGTFAKQSEYDNSFTSTVRVALKIYFLNLSKDTFKYIYSQVAALILPI